jgi:hypothetical protein
MILRIGITKANNSCCTYCSNLEKKNQEKEFKKPLIRAAGWRKVERSHGRQAQLHSQNNQQLGDHVSFIKGRETR